MEYSINRHRLNPLNLPKGLRSSVPVFVCSTRSPWSTASFWMSNTTGCFRSQRYLITSFPVVGPSSQGKVRLPLSRRPFQYVNFSTSYVLRDCERLPSSQSVEARATAGRLDSPKKLQKMQRLAIAAGAMRGSEIRWR